MARLALLILLAGCPTAPMLEEPCVSGEVACGWRQVDPQRLETRCFMLCIGGAWSYVECLPECGAGHRMEGANGSACAYSSTSCAAQ